MAKLKVFTWSDGFHAWTVATTSRPKALEAWGVGQDLFKTGLAREITDGADHDAALASPGQVIETGLAVDTGAIAPVRKTKAKFKAGPSKARREAVERLSRDLDALDEAQAQEMSELDAEMHRLRKRRETLGDDHETARTKLAGRLKAARAKL